MLRADLARGAVCAVVFACAAAAADGGPPQPAGSWSDLAGGVTGGGALGGVRALAVFDDGWGDGPVLYAAGKFGAAGDVAAKSIARWDGRAWSDVGGVSTSSGNAGSISAMVVWPTESGDILVVAGSFEAAGGVPAVNVAAWDGRSWSPLGDGLGSAWNGAPTDLAVLTETDPESGRSTAHLHAAGSFKHSGPSWFGPGVARFEDGAWVPVGPPLSGSGILGHRLAFHDDGFGPQLYVGGAALTSNGESLGPLARLEEESWAIADGVHASTGTVHVLRSETIDGAPCLLVGGTLGLVGVGDRDGLVVRRNGAWSAVGRGVRGSSTFTVSAVAALPDGLGAGVHPRSTALYAGGNFTMAGGTPAANIARWSGAFWTELAGGVSVAPPTDDLPSEPALDGGAGAPQTPLAMVLDPTAQGTGPRIIVAGGFRYAGALLVNGIAAWSPPDVLRPGPFPHRCGHEIEPIPAEFAVTALTEGELVAGYSDRLSFVVDDGEVATIAPPPPAIGVRILDVNDANIAVGSLEYGGDETPTAHRGFRLDLSTGDWTIFNVDEPACNTCGADAIGNDGTIYGWFGGSMYTWIDGVQTILPLPQGAVWMRAKGANSLGQAVGIWNSGAGLFPSFFDGQSIDGLALPPIDAEYGQARRINDAGSIIGRLGSIGAVWNDGVAAILLGPDQMHSDPRDINNASVIVGSSEGFGTSSRPTIWQDGVPRLLRELVSWRDAWHLGTPDRINEAGTIVADWTQRPFTVEPHGAALLRTAPTLAGDVDGDCRVDGYDLGLVLVEYGWNDSVADIDGDGMVDGSDLGLVLANWTS